MLNYYLRNFKIFKLCLGQSDSNVLYNKKIKIPYYLECVCE